MSGVIYNELRNVSTKHTFVNSSGTTTAVIDSAGRLGVGTTNPISKFHVVGDAFVTGTMTLSNLQVLGSNITVNAYETNSSNVVINNTSGLGPALRVAQTGSGVGYPIADFYDNEVSTTVPALRIADLGNVGIGTGAPGSKLTVYGAVGIGTAYAGTGAPTDSLIVSGKIGVGTVSPQASLHVNGDIIGNIKAAATGALAASGYVGEVFGAQRAGTGGSAYSIQTTTAITPSYTAMITQSLNPGLYLVGFNSSWYAGSGSYQVNMYLTVGATRVTNIMYQGTTVTNAYTGLAAGPIPIVITANNTTLALMASTALTTTAASHEMWITRLN